MTRWDHAVNDLIQLRKECHPAYHAAINDALKAIEKLRSPETIRIRIAIAIDDDYGAAAYISQGGEDDLSAMIECEANVADGAVIARAFVECDIPRIPTVAGRVVATAEGVLP